MGKNNIQTSKISSMDVCFINQTLEKDLFTEIDFRINVASMLEISPWTYFFIPISIH